MHLLCSSICGQLKTIHVYVALCDNEFQGIVPVSSSLGDGKNPDTNLYWGAAFGVRSFFKNKTSEWELVSSIKTQNANILDRQLFKHVSKNVYMLADAYDGEEIKSCIEDFLLASNENLKDSVTYKDKVIHIGGRADLVAYVGHNGLMDFNVDVAYSENSIMQKDAIILACYSKEYFSPELSNTKANPILWTTHLMAPEAYTLNAAITGWLNNETGHDIEEQAAQVYNHYQKCGIKGARNLFTTGY